MTEPTEREVQQANAEQLDRVAQIRARRAAAHPAGAAIATQLAARDLNSAAEPTVAPHVGSPSIAKAPRRRRHVAQGSRIVAAGLGATGMFGIVTMFGLASATTGANASAPIQPVAQPVAPVVAPPVQVVIHRIPATTGPTAPLDVVADGDPAGVPGVVAPQPVQLTANPVVQTVTVAAPSAPRSSGTSTQAGPAAQAPQPAPTPAPAPAATTSGSG
ncbi:MAG TPA: hypothetical protein PLP26_15275 [Ilumatobacteraceae bacterium]|nr:hypothetical protein [Ilumatobacteraceae bacterium]